MSDGHEWEDVVNSQYVEPHNHQRCRKCGLSRNKFRQRDGPGEPFYMAWGYFWEGKMLDELVMVDSCEPDEVDNCGRAAMRKVLG